MKLSKIQIEVLYTLTQPYKNPVGNRQHHPQDAFKFNTLSALEKRGLVEFYNYHMFLGGAVRITNLGRRILSENINGNI